MVILWSAAFAFVVDQLSKYYVVGMLDLARLRAIDVFPPYLNLRYGENRGINFGLFDGRAGALRWVLIAAALTICAIVLIWILRGRDKGPMMRASAGLLIGGALGNVLDRVLHGYVFDFLNMSCCGIANPFVFNLADTFIFLGALGLIVFDRPAARGKNGP